MSVPPLRFPRVSRRRYMPRQLSDIGHCGFFHNMTLHPPLFGADSPAPVPRHAKPLEALYSCRSQLIQLGPILTRPCRAPLTKRRPLPHPPSPGPAKMWLRTFRRLPGGRRDHAIVCYVLLLYAASALLVIGSADQGPTPQPKARISSAGRPRQCHVACKWGPDS